ncbi:hypothetical protein GBA52_010670 [Prunus armeniaca]|nr:hypothetical protein GBA52_010670 [Prunus armeniaca]
MHTPLSLTSQRVFCREETESQQKKKGLLESFEEWQRRSLLELHLAFDLSGFTADDVSYVLFLFSRRFS